MTEVASSAQMGAVFEELIRKFAELSHETAGEHFTPRDAIRLMGNLLFGAWRCQPWFLVFAPRGASRCQAWFLVFARRGSEAEEYVAGRSRLHRCATVGRRL